MKGRSPTVAIVLGALLAWCPGVFALDPSLAISQYAHTGWNVREGFSKGVIFTIAQGADGYLWLGTEFGLLRFDGVRNTAWQPPAGEHLPSNDIRSVRVARDGRLWIGTTAGLASWQGGRLTHYPELDGQVIEALLEDRDGTIWVGAWAPTVGRLCTIQSGRTQCYGQDGRLGSGVTSLYEDSGGNLWAGGATGVWRWKPGSPQLYSIPDATNRINALIEDAGGLLIAQNSGITRLKNGKAEAYPFPGLEFKPRRLLRDRDGGLWIGASIDHGLLHRHQGRTDRFTQSDGLSGGAISSLFEDREGNIWVATVDGLDRFRNFAVPTISVKEGLSSSGVSAVLAATDGTVWLGTDYGLNRWRNGQITIYRKRGAPAGSRPNATGSALPDDEVHSLFQDDRGRLWVATHRGVVVLESDRFVPIRSMPEGIVYSIAADGPGSVWISHRDALFHLRQARVVNRIPWSTLGRKDAAAVLLNDPLQGGLWLGFPEGDVVYFRDGQLRASYAAGKELGDGPVHGLKIDPDGTLWAATERGLSRLKDGHAITLSSTRGLPCDTVHWMLEDDAHSVWLYTACGLVRIARSELDAWSADPTRTIRTEVFDSSDGVSNHSFAIGYSPRVARSADGKLWFLPFGGVSVIDPHHLPVNNLPPPVQIEQITADGKTYWRNLSGESPSSPKLPALVRNLSIDYTALSLVAPETVRFRFKLEGQDADWREVVNDRRVEYSNLVPRHYTFRVTASNNSGVWNEDGAVLDFSIAPAYYQTTWFRALAVGTVLSLFWAAHRIRLRVVERHQGEITALNERLMKAQEQERIRIAGELHDGIMQQISALSLMLGTARRQIPPDLDAKAAVGNVQKKLIQVGADVRQLSHGLHPVALKDAGLPDALRAYCDEFSHVRGISLSYDADDSVRDLSRGAALALYRIAQEALGNAAAHGAASHVDVRLTRSDGQVFLSVSDDGQGFEPNRIRASDGLGLINMRERARQLNGTFQLDSEPGRGTTMKVAIPFRRAV